MGGGEGTDLLSSTWSTFSDGKIMERCLNCEAYDGAMMGCIAREMGHGCSGGESESESTVWYLRPPYCPLSTKPLNAVSSPPMHPMTRPRVIYHVPNSATRRVMPYSTRTITVRGFVDPGRSVCAYVRSSALF